MDAEPYGGSVPMLIACGMKVLLNRQFKNGGQNGQFFDEAETGGKDNRRGRLTGQTVGIHRTADFIRKERNTVGRRHLTNQEPAGSAGIGCQ